MPLPDGRTTPGLVEVAALPFKWLVDSASASSTSSALPASRRAPLILPRVSAVGYYDAQGASGAPTELQAVARAAEGTLSVVTARVHHDRSKGKFVFRNTRSVVLPLGEMGLTAGSEYANAAVGKRGVEAMESIPHPNLPLIARLTRSDIGAGGRAGSLKVEVHSWVNGGSHLQCIPCKPREPGGGQPGHTAGAEPGQAGEESGEGGCNNRSDSWVSSETLSNGGGRERQGSVAPLFSELAQKVKSGDELSFVPYALPSLTLGCCSLSQGNPGDIELDKHMEYTRGGSSVMDGDVCPCSRGEECTHEGGARIMHAMWLADWIGAESLSPALTVIDTSSRLHVFELDDGSATVEESACDRFDVSGGTPLGGFGHSKATDGSFMRRSWAQGGLGSTSSTASLSSLSHSMHHLHLLGGDGHEVVREASLERPSRRAVAEASGRMFVQEGLVPREKTVVLPLDSKYGLGLTLAFQDEQVLRNVENTLYGFSNAVLLSCTFKIAGTVDIIA